MISGSRLKQIRESRGLSQRELAEAVNIAQPVLSGYEADTRGPNIAIARKLADVLAVPTAMLVKTPLTMPEGSLGLFRSVRSKVGASDYNQARRMAEIALESVMILAEGVSLPTARLAPTLDTTPNEAAVFARSMLGLPPDEPILNVTAAVECAGAIVLKLTGLPDHIGGFSAWVQDSPRKPVIVCRSEVSAFRLRFTISHELGHILLGHQVFGRPTKDTESEANEFAANFLLPEKAMHDVFSAPIDLQQLARIKGRWGVSMNAILLRAKGMGYVTEGRYRAIYETMRRKGWLQQEPGDATTKPETSILLKDLLERQHIADSYSLAEITATGIRDARSLLPFEGELSLSTLIPS